VFHYGTAIRGDALGYGSKQGWGRHGPRPARLLALVALVDAIDRGILPGVLTKVQDDLGFSDTQMGTLAAAFILAGVVVVLPSGYLADRHDRTKLISVVLASWGIVSTLNALVRTFWQFLVIRIVLGAGETIDNPASQSLLADYYRPDARGRAFALQKVAPIVGASIGLGLGGLVGTHLGWRWAFVIVGLPGSLLAAAMWRLPEPVRGESDGLAEEEAVASVATPSDGRSARAVMLADVRVVMRVPSLRAVMVGSAIAAGALGGVGFWAVAFYERHSSLGTSGSAGVVAALLAVAALAGTLATGRILDRFHDRVEGLPLALSGVAELVGGAVLMVTFLPVPLWFRLPAQTFATACIVGGLLPLSVMIADVVPIALRGAAYSITGFFAAVVGAASPQAIGFLADRFPITVDGEPKGDLAKAFLIVTPLLLIGGLVVLRGRKHLAADIAAASAAAPATSGGTSPAGA
jgi:MFS family permease